MNTPRIPLPRRHAWLCVALLCFSAMSGFAQNVTVWNIDADGVWGNASNWNATSGNAPATGAGDSAELGGFITAGRTITIAAPIVLGQLLFSSINYFDGEYNVIAGGNLTLNQDGAGAGAATITFGGAANSRMTGNVSLADDLILDLESVQGATMNGALTGTGNLTVTGVGRVSFGSSDNTVASTFTGGIQLNGGLLVISGGNTAASRDARLGNTTNDLAFNGGALGVGGDLVFDANRTLTFNGIGGMLNVTGGTTTIGTVGQLAGAGQLGKSGVGNLIITGNNTGFTGDILVTGGLVDVTAAQGTGNGSGTAGKVVVGGWGGQYNSADVAQPARSFIVGPDAALQGGSIFLASLDRMTNGTDGNALLRRGAVIGQTVSGAAATVADLGTGADLLLGIGATLASESATLGGGSAWMGLSSTRSAHGAIGSGNFLVNGNITLQALRSNLVLGNGISTVNFTGNTGATAWITNSIGGVGASSGNGFIQLAGDNPNFAALSEFRITSGASLVVTGANGTAGLPVTVLTGGALGEFSTTNTTAIQSANAFGNSVVTLQAGAVVNLRADSAVNLGGNFVVASSLPVLFNANRAGATARLDIDRLTVGTHNASITIQSGGNKTFGIASQITGGNFDFAIGTQASVTLPANWAGSGTFTKADGNALTLTGNLTGYTGNIVVLSGTLAMLPTVATEIFGSTSGTSLFRIDDARSLDRQARGFGTLQVATDYDFSPRIDPASTGILALNLTSTSNLTGLGGSSAYLGIAGTGNRTLASATFAPGAGSTYRFGGGGTGNFLILDSSGNGVLTGNNSVVIGGPRSELDGTGAWSQGLGAIRLDDGNDYTGDTIINTGSSLTINAAGGIANGTTSGTVIVHGNLTLGGPSGLGTIGAVAGFEARPNSVVVISDAVVPSGDRLDNSVPMSISHATFTYSGQAAAANSTETFGNLTLGGGLSAINLNPGNAANSIALAFGNFTRSAGAVVNFGATSGTFGGAAAGDLSLALPGLGTGTLGWATVRNSDFASWNGTSIVSLVAAGRPTLASANSTTDDVRIITNESLGNQTTIGSLLFDANSTVDLMGGGLALSTGGLMVNGNRVVTIANGTLTSNSSELFVHVTNNTTTLSLAAGITGNVGLVARRTPGASGFTLLTGNGHSFSGNSTIAAGGLRIDSPLSGNPNWTIYPTGVLELRNNATTTFLTNGTIRPAVVQGAGGSSAPKINVDRLGGSSTRVELGVFNVDIPDGAKLAVEGGNSYRLVINGALTLGEESVLVAGSANTPIVVRGTYSDTATSVIRNGQNQFSGLYSHGLIFDNGISNTVNAQFFDGNNERSHLSAVGNGTVVNYQGYFAGGSSTAHLSAWNGGRLVIGANATIGSAVGWSGGEYGQRNQIAINGANGGVVAFDAGFVANKTVGTATRADVNFGGLIRLIGTIETNHSQNLSDYMTALRFENGGARWITKTNAQVFDQTIHFSAAEGIIETVSDLALTGPVFLGTALDPQGAAFRSVMRDWQLTGAFDIPDEATGLQAGQFVKEGAGTLSLSGPVVISNYAQILAREGNLTAEGRFLTTAPEGVLSFDTSGNGTVVQNYNLEIRDATSLTVKTNGATNNVTIQNGKVLQGGGRLLNDVTVNSGGTVQGNLFLQNVTNTGTVAPGDSPGTLFTRNYTQTASGNLNIEINGGPTARTLWDHLVVGGQAVLNGVLNLIFDNPLVTLAGDTWRFLTSAGVTGNFTTVNITAPGNLTASDFVVEYGADYVQVKRNGTAATTYDTWKLTYWPSPDANDDWNDDPDLDGNNNLTEYALDTDPLTADAELLPVTVEESGGNLTLGYTRPGGAANFRSDLVYKVQRTTDLSGTALLNTDTPAGTDTDPTNISIPSPVAYGSVAREFLDLRIEFTSAPAP
jgi:fibronectin-binding autotransporter adhesin